MPIFSLLSHVEFVIEKVQFTTQLDFSISLQALHRDQISSKQKDIMSGVRTRAQAVRSTPQADTNEDISSDTVQRANEALARVPAAPAAPQPRDTTPEPVEEDPASEPEQEQEHTCAGASHCKNCTHNCVRIETVGDGGSVLNIYQSESKSFVVHKGTQKNFCRVDEQGGGEGGGQI